jgi:hypothetical protein
VSQSILERVPILAGARQKKQENELASYFKKQYDSAKSARSTVERQWVLNYAFFMGRQNAMFIKSSTAATNYRLFVPPAPPWRVRLVINKVRGIVRKEISKTTSAKPIFTVSPKTTEDEDTIAARAAEAILYSAYTEKELQTVFQQAAFWRAVCGVGYIKVWWDGAEVDRASQQMGDICVERVRPYNIVVPNLLEEDIEKQPYVIHTWCMPPEEAQARYNMSKKPQGSVNSINDILEDSMLDLSGGAKTSSNEEVQIMEIWIKKHPDFPQGGLVTLVGDEVVQNLDQYPYAHWEYPFAKLDHIPTGKFYPESTVTDIIVPQRELNRTRSQLVENKNTIGRPRVIAEKGSIVASKISNEPGQVIEKVPGTGPVQILDAPQMPAYIMNELAELQNDLDDLSGQHEISRGNTPPQVTAATAISYLQEQDDSVLSLTIESQEKAVRKIGRMYLSLAEQYWNTERMIKVVGTDGYFDVQQLQGSAIKGNTDVRVESGSALSTSKAAKQAVIMDLMKNGLIDPMAGLQRMEIGGVEKLYEDMQIDIRQAQRENIRMSQGQPIQVNDYDNHKLHIDIHNKYRKTQQFEILPPEIQAIFMQHVELHKGADAAIMQQQMMMEMQAQGQVNGPVGQPDPNTPQLKPPPGTGGS